MTYEYACTSCGHQWEAEQPISARPLTTCPACNHETAKRMVSGGAGFILKGGGWYADGYGSKKADKPGDKAETKSEPKKTESKTETPATETKSNGSTAASEPAKAEPAKTEPAKKKADTSTT